MARRGRVVPLKPPPAVPVVHRVPHPNALPVDTKRRHSIRILVIIAREVMTKLCSLIKSMEVVNTTGPVIRGHADRHGTHAFQISSIGSFLGRHNIPNGNDKKRNKA